MSEKTKNYTPVLAAFALINLLVIALGLCWKSLNLDIKLVIGANCLLCLISCINVSNHLKAMRQTNPHAMVRGVMSTTVLKLFVLGTAAFLYLYNAGEHKNINGLFLSMGLYIFYTWLDVRIALKGNPEKKDGNSN